MSKKISTKDLFDEYFKSDEGIKKIRYRSALKENQLYAYEEKIGKEFIEWRDEDFIDFLSNLQTRKSRASKTDMVSSTASFDHFLTFSRQIFEYYIDHYEVIKNPLRNPRMRGANLIHEIAKYKCPLTTETLNNIISKLHREYPTERADYIELIVLLFYNGFPDAEKIVQMKEENINHRTKTVTLPGTVIQLSDRCYYLLQKFHNMSEIIEWRNYALVSWNGSYFKFIIQSNKANDIDNRSMAAMKQLINFIICRHINDKFNLKINYSSLYYLGVYEFMVGKFGKSELDRMLASNYDKDALNKIRSSSREYGCTLDNVNALKRKLRMYSGEPELE